MTRLDEPVSDYPPAGMELRLIERHAHLKDRRILEIGCGDGRLTLLFAPQAGSVVAFDPDEESIALARQLANDQNINNVRFETGSVEQIRLGSEPFDVVLFSWSL